MTDRQLTAHDLEDMSPAEIVTAKQEGRLAAYLGAPAEHAAALDRAHTGDHLTDEDVTALWGLGRHDLINEAKSQNRITTTTTTEVSN